MGRRFPDGGLLRYRKWVPQQLGDVNKQGSGDSRPIGARHGNTSANHTDLQSGYGWPCVFAVRMWSNLWDLIGLRTSHYSMALTHSPVTSLLIIDCGYEFILECGFTSSKCLGVNIGRRIVYWLISLHYASWRGIYLTAGSVFMPTPENISL